MLPQRREIASVVVCEDDTPTLELLCDNLVADRFGVLPAPSASDALRLCRYNHPDLLLLDLTLPDASGLDVLREIRDADGVTSRFDPRLPVIVLTGRGADDDRVRGLEFGADDYVVKPFHYPELRARIARGAAARAGAASGPLPGRRDRRRPGAAQGLGRRARGARSPTRSSRCCGCWPPTRTGSSPSASCSRRSGATARRPGRGRSIRTRAACGANSTPSTARFVVNCWGVGYRLIDG